MTKAKNNLFFYLTSFLIAVGFGLTILSWLEICSSACEIVHFYKFWGYDFELLGFLFFITLIPVHLLSRTYSWLSWVTTALLASAIGMELNFLRVQKYVIGEWCPVCVSIAAAVGLTALVYTVWFFYESKSEKGFLMRSFIRGGYSLSIGVIGFLIAFMAVAKPTPSFADLIANEGEPFFGKASSDVEVYIVTDWFCSACKKKEPMFQNMYPAIMSEAKLFFIDVPIHPESMNYLPYNLTFMIKHKDQYFKIREKLIELAKETKHPTLQMVESAVAPYGVKYEPLGYSDIDSGRRFFEGIVDTFKVTRTPTVVVANQRKLEAKKFAGGEISEANILRAIKELQ